MLNNPEIVTRYIGYPRHFDVRRNVVYAGAFDTPKNRENREISVYNIGDLLRNNNFQRIYEIGDRIYKKPPTPARADLTVTDIENILYETQNLFIESSIFGRHCNIKPFPADDAKALAISQQLAQISRLHVRNQ